MNKFFKQDISFFYMNNSDFIAQDTENYREYSLPYNWKKVGHRRQTGTKTWDFYIITPCGKRLRSTVEVNKYLAQNPDVECDRDVTNCNRPSDLSTSRGPSTSSTHPRTQYKNTCCPPPELQPHSGKLPASRQPPGTRVPPLSSAGSSQSRSTAPFH